MEQLFKMNYLIHILLFLKHYACTRIFPVLSIFGCFDSVTVMSTVGRNADSVRDSAHLARYPFYFFPHYVKLNADHLCLGTHVTHTHTHTHTHKYRERERETDTNTHTHSLSLSLFLSLHTHSQDEATIAAREWNGAI
jgi:hypothetical protein